MSPVASKSGPSKAAAPPAVAENRPTAAAIGVLRVWLWPGASDSYTEHFMLVGLVIGCSLIGVVLFGTIVGSGLPFLLRRFGADPASASAPAVATLVDVTGLVIYFSVAYLVLRGTLL